MPTGGASQRSTSCWTTTGFPGAGSIPPVSPGENPTNATTGSFPIQNPATGNRLYLAQVNQPKLLLNESTVVLYDRVYHMSGLNATLTTAQNVDPTPTFPINRGAGVGGLPDGVGEDVEMWVEIYSSVTTTTGTLTASYTNSSGVAGRSTIATSWLAGNANVAFQLPLQAGDTGVSSVQTLTCSAASSTAGNFGITLARRVAEFGMKDGAAYWGLSQDPFSLGMVPVYNNACLAFLLLPADTTGTHYMMGTFHIIEG